MTRTLFVCLGNICHSPIAEGLLKKRIASEGKGAEFSVGSAATGTYEVGKTPHPEARGILDQENVNMTNMAVRRITPHGFETFDRVIGMDQESVEELKRRAPRLAQERIHLFLSSTPGKEKESVPDPYCTNSFDKTYQLITEGSDHWWNIWMDEDKITNNF